MNKEKKKIGEICVENGFITRDVLEEALSYQREYGVGITEYLFAKGYLDEKKLAKCIAEQFKTPYISLSCYDIPGKVLKLVPADISEKYCLVPLDKINDVLTVVMADPLDAEATEELTRITGCVIEPLVGLISDIHNAIKSYYNINIRMLQAKKTEERRIHKRINKALIFLAPSLGMEEHRAINISQGGLLMGCGRFLSRNQELKIILKIPDKRPVHCRARVIWVYPGTKDEIYYKIGLQFLGLSPEDREKLNELA